jgi:hypothetical protein
VTIQLQQDALALSLGSISGQYGLVGKLWFAAQKESLHARSLERLLGIIIVVGLDKWEIGTTTPHVELYKLDKVIEIRLLSQIVFELK